MNRKKNNFFFHDLPHNLWSQQFYQETKANKRCHFSSLRAHAHQVFTDIALPVLLTILIMAGLLQAWFLCLALLLI